MIKIALIGIAASLIAAMFKSIKSEYSLYIGLAGCLLVFALGVTKLQSILQVIDRIKAYISISPTYVAILLKMIGITYVAEFSACLCKDAGHDAISKQIEMVGKLTILSLSMPIILSLLDTIKEFLA